MVSITYSLTPEDYAELEAQFERERRNGWGRRVWRVAGGGIVGFLGVFATWQALFFFPWTFPSHNLLIAGTGLLMLWVGLQVPGLRWLLQRLSDPYATCELRIYDGNIVSMHSGKPRQYRWRAARGFKENEKFFFLRAHRDDVRWAIPKRAVAPEQEMRLRELVLRASVEK